MKIQEQPARFYINLDEDEVRQCNEVSNKLGVLQANLNDFNKKAQTNELGVKEGKDAISSMLEIKSDIDSFFKKLVEEKGNLNGRE